MEILKGDFLYIMLPMMLFVASLMVAMFYTEKTTKNNTNRFLKVFNKTVALCFVFAVLGAGVNWMFFKSAGFYDEQQKNFYKNVKLSDMYSYKPMNDKAFYISSIKDTVTVSKTSRSKIDVLSNDENFKNNKITITDNIDKNSLVLYDSNKNPVKTLEKWDGSLKVDNNTIVFTPNKKFKYYEHFYYGATVNGVKYYSDVTINQW